MAPASISNFISAISQAGGMSMTNGYDVEFNFGNRNDLKSWLIKVLGSDPSSTDSPSKAGFLIQHLCDEAQLPNIQSATGQVTGVVLGEGAVSYPHTKLYSDFSLGWMSDANMTPLKFLTAWYDYIYGEGTSLDSVISDKTLNLESLKSKRANPIDRTTRLKFPSEYLCDVKITKTERGRSAPNSRAPISYLLQDCYPYSIDAVPLSYGTSQITKVTANFYYRKHTIIYNNISGKYTG